MKRRPQFLPSTNGLWVPGRQQCQLAAPGSGLVHELGICVGRCKGPGCPPGSTEPSHQFFRCKKLFLFASSRSIPGESLSGAVTMALPSAYAGSKTTRTRPLDLVDASPDPIFPSCLVKVPLPSTSLCISDNDDGSGRIAEGI